MKKSTRTLLFSVIGVVVLIAAGMAVLAYTGAAKTDQTAQEETVTQEEPQAKYNPLTGLEVASDTELPTRPVIFSIDNVGDAVPQSNTSYADIIYEFPVEGLQTRLQVLFYGDFPEFVGPIRSVRPYFIDMVREHNAIYVAHGWSHAAKKYLHEDVVPYLNAMDNPDDFYRVSDKEAPHNSYIKWDHLSEIMDANNWWDTDEPVKGFRFADSTCKTISTTSEENAFDQVTESVVEAAGGSDTLNSETAEKVSFHYAFADCSFEYDSEDNNYDRFVYGSPYIDKESGDQLAFENILVQKVASTVLDEKGRLSIDMCLGGDACLITGGKAYKGTWSRANLNSQTIFKDETGREFRLTPGKTFVEVIDQNCSFTY